MSPPTQAIDFICHVLYAFGIVHLTTEAFAAAATGTVDVCTNFWAAIHDLILLEVCGCWDIIPSAKAQLSKLWEAVDHAVTERHLTFIHHFLLEWQYPDLRFFTLRIGPHDPAELLRVLSWLVGYTCLIERYMQTHLLANMPAEELLPPFAPDPSVHHGRQLLEGACPGPDPPDAGPGPPAGEAARKRLRALADEVLVLYNKIQSTAQCLGGHGQRGALAAARLAGAAPPYPLLLGAAGNAGLRDRHCAALRAATGLLQRLKAALRSTSQYFVWVESVGGAAPGGDALDGTAAMFLSIPLPGLEQELAETMRRFETVVADVQAGGVGRGIAETWAQSRQAMDPALFNNLKPDLRQIAHDADLEFATVEAQLHHFLAHMQCAAAQAAARTAGPSAGEAFAAACAPGPGRPCPQRPAGQRPADGPAGSWAETESARLEGVAVQLEQQLEALREEQSAVLERWLQGMSPGARVVDRPLAGGCGRGRARAQPSSSPHEHGTLDGE